MRLKQWLAPTLAGLGMSMAANAADHIDAPFTTGMPNADINDVYAYTKADELVLVMTVYPFADSTTRLHPDYLYQFKIDTDADLVEDLVLQITAQGTGDNQRWSVSGPRAPQVTGTTGNRLNPVDVQGDFNAMGQVDGLKAYVGLRDDPFFFDLARYLEILADAGDNGAVDDGGFNDPGVDTLAGANTIGIVLEVPRAAIGSGVINVWATSSKLAE